MKLFIGKAILNYIYFLFVILIISYISNVSLFAGNGWLFVLIFFAYLLVYVLFYWLFRKKKEH